MARARRRQRYPGAPAGRGPRQSIETGPQRSAKREGFGFEPALHLGMRLILIALEHQQIVVAPGGDLCGNLGSAGECVQTDHDRQRRSFAPAGTEAATAASEVQPGRSRPLSRLGSAVSSPRLASVAGCASTSPCCANAPTRCKGGRPFWRSNERRTVLPLPSIAIYRGAPAAGQKAERTQLRKQRSKRSGSISISARPKVSYKGNPPGSSRKRSSQPR